MFLSNDSLRAKFQELMKQYKARCMRFYTYINECFVLCAERVRKHKKNIVTSCSVIFVVVVAMWFVFPAPVVVSPEDGGVITMYRHEHIVISFNQMMNKKSVERAFSVSPQVLGDFSWNANQLTFSPRTDLEKGVSYKVLVGASARNKFFKSLKREWKQTYNILDYPEIIVVTPADQSIIMQDQRLTVLFDKPIRSLERETIADSLVTFEPSVEGKFEWLGTSGFEFVPTNGWPAATAFTATIHKGVEALNGTTTAQDYVWKFQTSNVSTALQQEYQDTHMPRDPVVLNFNYAVSPLMVRNGLAITRLSSHEGKEVVEIVPTSQFLVTAHKDDPNSIDVIPRGGFDLGYSYIFNLPQGFTAGIGLLGLTADFTGSIKTDEKGFHISEQAGRDVTICVHCSLEVTFNNTPEVSLVNSVHITPELVDKNIYSYYRGKLQINGQFKPSTRYTITFDKRFADIHGQKLERAEKIVVTTDPYEPSVEYNGYNQYGVFASHLPRVYQLRTLNITKPIAIQLCSGSTKNYIEHTDFDCNKKYEKQYEGGKILNEYSIVDVDMDAIAGQTLPLGVYELKMTMPEIQDKYQQGQQTKLMMVANTALTVKWDRNGEGKILVWATDMKTGESVSGVDVNLWNEKINDSGFTKILDIKKTGADGVVVFENVMGEGVVQGNMGVSVEDTAHFGYVSANWNDGIASWNYGLEESYSDTIGNQYVGYVYTDRTIYRADQKVFFKAVIRRDIDARLSIPKQKEVRVTITDANGLTVSEQTLPVSSYGTVHGELQLTTSMPLGTYSIQLFTDGQDGKGPTIGGQFDVREYRRPDFKVNIDAPDAAYAGETIRIPVHAEYYHGVALNGASVSYSVARRKLFFQPLKGEWYNYSTDDAMFDCWWYCRTEGNFETLVSNETKLDQNGNIIISLPANLTDYTFSATYQASVTVTDINNRSVSYTSEFPVHKGEFYVGIRSNYSRGWNSNDADFDIVSVNIDGTRRKNIELTVSLYQREWTYVQRVDTIREFLEPHKKDTLLETQKLVTDGEGVAFVGFKPTGSGEFVAVIRTNDARGNTLSASANRYVYAQSSDALETVRVSDDHQMKIIQTKASYAVGESASLSVQTPYKLSKALVTVERNSILSYHVVDLGTSSRVVEIPITEDAVPNVYVSVLALKGGGETGIPEFRLGYAQLQVDTNKKILDVKLSSDKQTYKPGEKVILTVSAHSFDGKPARAELSLAVVDERVVALLGSIDKNILGKFWFPRTIGVQTAQTLTMLVKKVFYATEGGGGGKGDSGKVAAVRGNFKDTAYWHATVETDDAGFAQVSFDLPDNLTSWQVLAIGATRETIVGSAETTIKVKKEVMVEPLVPRMVRHNDTLLIGATLFNATDESAKMDVTIDADWLEFLDAKHTTMFVGAQSRTPVLWRVKVPQSGEKTHVTVSVTSRVGNDGFTVDLPILPFSVAESVSLSGILERSSKETIIIPKDIIKNVGDVTVSVAPNIGNGLQSGLDYLVKYPYGCAEQKTSSMIANLLFDQLARLKVTQTNSDKQSEAKKNVEAGILELLAMQRQDGGFGFWAESDKSYPHLSGYVLWGLTQAQKAGFSVPETSLNNLDVYVRSTYEMSYEHDYDKPSDAEQAQNLFMLSERNTDGLAGYAGTLYERRAQLPLFAKAFLAMAYINIDASASSEPAQRLMNDIHNKLTYLNPSTAYIQDQKVYDYLMSSDVRSTSVYLQALLRFAPQDKDAERIVRYLMSTRVDGNWETTHNTTMALLALVEYVRVHPIDDTAQNVALFLNDRKIEDLAFPRGDLSSQQSKVISLSSLQSKVNEHDIKLEKENTRRYFYDITMKTYRAIEDIKPFESGFSLIADMYALSDKKYERPLRSASVGDTVKIRMRVIAPKLRRYVALEYHLPAGLEAIDASLKTSPKNVVGGGTLQCSPVYGGGENCVNAEGVEWSWWWENVWKHIEMRDDRVFLFADALNPGVYTYEFLATAVTEGEFRVPPARVYEFYNPLSNAHNAGTILRIKK